MSLESIIFLAAVFHNSMLSLEYWSIGLRADLNSCRGSVEKIGFLENTDIHFQVK